MRKWILGKKERSDLKHEQNWTERQNKTTEKESTSMFSYTISEEKYQEFRYQF